MPIARPPPPPVIDNVPRALTTYISHVNHWAQQSMTGLVPRNEAVDHLYLRSPAGKVYSLTVSDTGVLTVTLLVLGENP